MESLTLTTILQYLIDIDTDIFMSVNRYHNAYWDTFMYLFSEKEVWVPMYLTLIFVLIRNNNWRVIGLCVLALCCIFLFTDTFLASIVRPWVARLRPSNLENPLSATVHIVDDWRGGRYGFPSNHAANCWALAFFCWWLFRRKAITIFLVAWALITCYSRSYLGVHYPGDLLAGMLFGLAASSLCYYVFHRISGYTHTDELRYEYLPVATGIFTIIVLIVVSFF